MDGMKSAVNGWLTHMPIRLGADAHLVFDRPGKNMFGHAAAPAMS
jgi:hypothetical protein